MPGKTKPKDDQADRASTKKKLSLKQRLIKALAHPLRVKILALLNDREWSPNELSEELATGLSGVSYHVKVLKDFELIEMTKTEPRRGAVEHYYRAVERAFIPSGMTKHIPKSGQKIIGNDILREIDKDVAASLKSNRFYARDDWHTSWTPAVLDDRGCKDAEALADQFIEDFLKIEAESAQRRAESEDGGEYIPTSAAILVFGSEHKTKSSSRMRRNGRSKKRRSG